jgi:hypothetical protein
MELDNAQEFAKKYMLICETGTKEEFLELFSNDVTFTIQNIIDDDIRTRMDYSADSKDYFNLLIAEPYYNYRLNNLEIRITDVTIDDTNKQKIIISYTTTIKNKDSTVLTELDLVDELTLNADGLIEDIVAIGDSDKLTSYLAQQELLR